MTTAPNTLHLTLPPSNHYQMVIYLVGYLPLSRSVCKISSALHVSIYFSSYDQVIPTYLLPSFNYIPHSWLLLYYPILARFCLGRYHRCLSHVNTYPYVYLFAAILSTKRFSQKNLCVSSPLFQFVPPTIHIKCPFVPASTNVWVFF